MSAKITFTSDTSTLPVVMVSKNPPNFVPIVRKKDLPAFKPEDIISSNFAQTGTVHEANLINLEPDTDYHFVISGHDKATGWWWKQKGKFHTLRRAVSITFEKIKVIDDNDDLSDGDFAFGFFINGNISPNGPVMSFGGEIGTDESKTANLTGISQMLHKRLR